MARETVSILLPMYNEERQIEKSIVKISDILNAAGIVHEFILVDDGSRDHTWEKTRELAGKYGNINAIRLSRNFGKEAALCAGLAAVRTDACVILDADLQHPPALIPEMVRVWREEDVDVVDTIKTYRGKESVFNTLFSTVFYATMKRVSGFDLFKASDYKLLDKKVIEAWKTLGEVNTFFRGMSAWVGFSRRSLGFRVEERETGKSKWSFKMLLRLAENAVVYYSSTPVKLPLYFGGILLAVFAVLGVWTAVRAALGAYVGESALLALLILLIGGMILVGLGITGVYISKVFDEVKGRPRYLVGETIVASAEKREGD